MGNNFQVGTAVATTEGTSATHCLNKFPTPVNSEKLVLFDRLRTIAIFLILLDHLEFYSFNFLDLRYFSFPYNLSLYYDLNPPIAVGLFVFISGYFLNLNPKNFLDENVLKNFVYQKFLRIFPLYYLALIAFVFMTEGKFLAWQNIIIHLFGLQLILRTSENLPLLTLWFIGLITIFYVLFIIFRISLLTSYQSLKILGMGLLIIFPFLLLFLYQKFNITDIRLIQYYGIFWLGVFCHHDNFIEKSNRLFSLLFLPIFILFYFLINHYFELRLLKDSSLAEQLFLTNLLMVISLLFFYHLCELFPKHERLNQFCQHIAFSSYCIYLFHRPIWFTLKELFVQGLGINNPYILLAVAILIGLPIIVNFSQWGQSLYHSTLLRIFR